ncbi:kinase-like domain-containing protein, partial [Truncatella angustata]
MAHQISSVPDAHENGINKIRDKGSDLLHDSRIANTSETGTHLPGDNRRLYKVCWDDMTELEDPEKYRAGGFHPVNIDTYLDLEERFEVHHKLGYGHYGTVWACFDTKKEDWVAIKILQHRDSNENCPELRLLEQLAGISVEELEENHIFLAREYFWLSGPNGRHLCLVNPLLGPSIRDVEDVGLHTPELLTDICFQICKAISFLHSKGICHGDISPGNILFQLDQEAIMEDELSGRQLERYLGEVLAFDLATTWGGTTAPYGPEKLYLRGSTEQLEQKYRTGKIAIIDFGLSYLSKDDPNEGLDFQISYAAPELLTTTGHGGPSTDVWALAATLFEIR